MVFFFSRLPISRGNGESSHGTHPTRLLCMIPSASLLSLKGGGGKSERARERAGAHRQRMSLCHLLDFSEILSRVSRRSQLHPLSHLPHPPTTPRRQKNNYISHVSRGVSVPSAPNSLPLASDPSFCHTSLFWGGGGEVKMVCYFFHLSLHLHLSALN